jgi:hypothetical protein
MIMISVMRMEIYPARGPIKRVEKTIKAKKKKRESPRIPVSEMLASPKISGNNTKRLALGMYEMFNKVDVTSNT